MRIAMVANQFPKFSETFIVSKFLALIDRGWDVHVVCRQSDPVQWALFPALTARPAVKDRVHLTTDLEATLTSIQPDLVHFEFGVLAVGKTHLKARLGCKLVVSFRGTDLYAMAIDTPGYYTQVFDDADVLHVLGRQLWAQARRRGCPGTKRHVFIPPGIDAAFAAGPARDHTEWVGSETRPLRLLSVGRLTWTKGYEFGLQAVRRLQDQGVRCEYHVVGEGEARKELTFDIHDLGLASTVSLLGVKSRDTVRDHMAWADVLLHPARYEGFCNVVLEAQALGLPVVCSDGGGLAENVVHGETGLVTPRRDPAAMAAAVATLADPARRRRLGAGGRRRATAHFDADGQIEAFDRLYREALNVTAGTHLAAARHEGAAPPATTAPQLLQTVEAEARAQDSERLELIEAIRMHVAETLPQGARLSVVSRGDEDLLRHDGRACSHFPAAADGGYAGYHPGDSSQAIAALQAAREGGAGYLLIPRTAFWWLDHYTGFRRYLRERCRSVVATDCCVIFDLGTSPAGDAVCGPHVTAAPAVTAQARAGGQVS